MIYRQHHAICRFVRRDAEQPARQRLSAEESAELANGEPAAVWGPRSRVDRYLGMLAKLGDPAIALRQAVLSDAKREGTFAVVAPLLAELATAHEDLIAAGSECADARESLPQDLEERHRKAFLALMPYQREEGAQLDEAPPAVDGDFVLAIPAVWKGRLGHRTAFVRWLKRTPWNVVRRRGERKKLEINAGDWMRYWIEFDRNEEQAEDAAGLQQGEVDAQAAARRRAKFAVDGKK